MYEALEATAKIVTGRPKKDLSANAELFIKTISASDRYKNLLKDYIEYANQFRHAVEKGKQRPQLSAKEAESSVYLTGLFPRLAVSSPVSFDRIFPFSIDHDPEVAQRRRVVGDRGERGAQLAVNDPLGALRVVGARRQQRPAVGLAAR